MNLSTAEFEVLLAATEGEPVVATAERLGCSFSTIAERRKRVLRKLGAPTMPAAVAAAYHRGLLVAPGTRSA